MNKNPQKYVKQEIVYIPKYVNIAKLQISVILLKTNRA